MSSNNYKISVVIAFCCKRYVELNLLLDSIVNQTYQADEIIIVSDGNDNQLKKKINFKNCIVHYAPKKGIPAPLRNLGILMVQTQKVSHARPWLEMY